MNFNESMIKINEDFLNSKENEKIGKFKSFHKVAINNFSKEFFELLKSYGLSKELIILQNNSLELLNSIDSYKICLKKKTISVKLGNATIEEPLCDVLSMVESHFLKKSTDFKQSWEWNLIGSYISDSKNYLNIQLSKAIILQEK